jgi:hypothetical protein
MNNAIRQYQTRLRRVRILLSLFVLALVLSGLTAFPLVWELRLLTSWFGSGTAIGDSLPGLAQWLDRVSEGLESNAVMYPFIAYGTDWLAFAHIVIGISFIGPIRDPVRNIWVIEFAMIACVLVVPLALICGPIRGIPIYWQLIDCSFGVFGLIPLWIARKMIQRLTA